MAEADSSRQQVDSDEPAATTATPTAGERATTAAAGTTVGLTSMIVRVIDVLAGVAVLVLVVNIVLRLLNAHAGNSVVNRIAIWAHWLANPFVGMFSLHSAKWTHVVNYGVAAIAYLIVAAILVALLRALTTPARRHLTYGGGRPVAH
jgi:hypothetical protein